MQLASPRRILLVGVVLGSTWLARAADVTRALAAAGPDPGHPPITTPSAGLKPFDYRPARVPYYPPSAQRSAGRSEPLPRMQQPVDPEESRNHALTPRGFRVELYASEPLIEGKPLAMCFDADGATYVAESVDYPNDLVEPGQGEGRDRIVRLVDTDGDGKADRRDVFAESLSIPTSMLAHDGGLIVAQAPQMLYLKDVDGDGRSDVRKVLFAGWGTGDTHAGPSNLTWGLDGHVYGMVGYAGFSGQVGGENLRFGSGFFRFRPDGSRLEHLRSTNNNSWGFGFSEEGLVFGSTANGNPSEHMPLPNRVYERVRGWSPQALHGIAGSPKMELAPQASGAGPVAIRQVDHHGHFTAAAGHRLYTARAYPREYWNRTAFVCEPTGHIVATFPLTPEGAAFKSRMGWNLVASDDEWTAPIQAEVGPDGQVWVVDWYNFIVQHNPTPAGFETGRRGAYVTPLRDKTRGRIWRVVHEACEGPTAARKSLATASPDDLVALLRDDNMFWRERAQRKLVERAAGRPDGGRDVVPALAALVVDPAIDAIGLSPGAIHGIWTLRQLGALEGPHADQLACDSVRSAFRHPCAGVRMNAVKALPRDAVALQKLVSAGLAADPVPLVRLAVLEALGECAPSAEAGAILTAMLADPRTLADPVLADAATSAAAVHAAHVLPGLITAADDGPAPARLALAERVVEHVARGADEQAVMATIERLPAAPVDLAGAAVTGLARGWPKGRAVTFGPATEAAIAQVIDTLPPAAQGQLVTFARNMGSPLIDSRVGAIARALLATVDDEGATEAQRGLAAERFIALSDTDRSAVTAVMNRIDARMSPELATALVTAAGHSATIDAAAVILDRLPRLPPRAREAVVRTVLAKRNWAPEFVERLEQGAVRLEDLSLVERTRLTSHPDAAIRDRAYRLLAAGGGLPNADRQQVIDKILPVTLAGGDADRGKAVFKEHCAKCHVHNGDGGKVGPELTGMAIHPPREMLIHILDPNRSVEGNYRSYTVTTQDGRVVTGLLVSESKTAIEVIDGEGRRVVIQRMEIDEFTPSPHSLMPSGFEKLIPPEGFADLLEFLRTRGKFVPLPLAKVATAVSTVGMFYSADATVERLVFGDWGPKDFHGVPFAVVDPRGQSVPNVVMLHGPLGYLPPRMPKSVSLPVGSATRAIHMLGGIAGWGHPASTAGETSMIVRLVYADRAIEDHRLVNGEHVADYIRRVEVPESEFAFDLDGRQVRYLRIEPGRVEPIASIELVKGEGPTAPIVVALTLEMP